MIALVIRQGPIPAWLHGILEYAAGVLLIVSQFIFNFQSGAAQAVSIIAGVFVIFVAATTSGSTSLINQVPISVHVLLDYALAAVLVASPFLFGYSNERNPTIFFIALGIFHLLVTIATRFLRDRPGEAKAPGDARPV